MSYDDDIRYFVGDGQADEHVEKCKLLKVCSGCGFIAVDICDHDTPDGYTCDAILGDWWEVPVIIKVREVE